MAVINRRHKDRLFCFLFGSENHKDWTLSLYNAVNGSSYTNPDDIRFTTIGDVIYMGMKDDASFLISDILSIYEQQSSFNPNMPVRMLMYAGRLYDKFIHVNHLNIYSSSRVHLPAPKLVVFYNGPADMDDTVLRLSDAFAPDADSDIEVRVRMVNINPGHNTSLMQQCAPLAEYSWLTGRIRSYRLHMDIADAVDAALDDMPESFLIRPFLFANRAEVKNMCITEYNEAETMQLFKEEGRIEGRIEGHKEGHKEGFAEAEARFGRLMSLLLAEGRTEDAQKAAVDSLFRTRLCREYGIF